jgi:hypothetical protein
MFHNGKRSVNTVPECRTDDDDCGRHIRRKQDYRPPRTQAMRGTAGRSDTAVGMTGPQRLLVVPGKTESKNKNLGLATPNRVED